jgi:poly(hydroxyalkanoate) depolymerase family esterase
MPFCEALAAAGYRVIRFDNRDSGLSTRIDTADMLAPVPAARRIATASEQILRRSAAMCIRSIFRRWSAGALLALLCMSTYAGTTESFTFDAKSYSGSRERQYKVYVPDGLSGPAPMVMALHGCQQTNDDVLADWGLTSAADRFGFILVAPFITSYDGLRNTNCWGFWFDAHRHQGMGEPEDLHQIALEVEGRFNVDPARRYITGLSSGAAMSVVAAVTHNEYWAAAASASGLPYGEDAASVSISGQCPGSATFHAVDRVASDMRSELDNSYAIPLMVLQNDRDCTVVQPAGRNIRDAQLKVIGYAAHDTPAEARAAQSGCTPAFGEDYGCQHVFYTVDGKSGSRSLTETVFYSGPLATPNRDDTDHGHYWIGGENGNNGKWSLQRGPSYPDIVWDFFSRHPRGGTPPHGSPRIALNGDNPMQINLGQTFVDPGATATDPEDGNLPVSADCGSVDSSRVGRYACIYSATDSAGNTASASRTVVVVDPNAPLCTTVNASPAAHVSAGRAVRGGLFNLRALSNGDRQDIGFGWDYFSTVALYEGQQGRWYARVPAACRR